MSFMSKTTTVRHNVLKDKPTPRIPIRGNYPTWKVSEKDAFIPSLTIKNSEGILKCGTGLSPILKRSSNSYSHHKSSKIPCSVKSSTYSSITTVKTTANNSNLNENRIAFSKPSNLKTLQNNDLVTPRPAIRDFTMVTNESDTEKRTITSSQEIINKKSLCLTGEAFFGEEFFPHISHKSILDDMNILKTPVNDSLTRRTILSNVVPVTSLITKTHHYKEYKTTSDVPTPRHAIRSDSHLINNVSFNLDGNTASTQVKDSQAIPSPTEENVLDTCSNKEAEDISINSHINQSSKRDSHTSLQAREVSESATVTSEDVLSTTLEESQLPIQETITTTLSRQDTEPFVVTEIDLTIEDGYVIETGSYVVDKEGRTTNNTIFETNTEPEITFSAIKRTVDKDNEVSETIFPSSDIIINLPPLISPINSDNTKTSDEIKIMIPDSTTDLISNTPRVKNNTKNKTRETSLRRKIQSRHLSVKRKITEDPTSRSHSKFDKTKKLKIDKIATVKPSKVEKSKRKTQVKKSNKHKIVKQPFENKNRNEDDGVEQSTPRTRNLMINPRTKQKRSPALLKMN